MQASTKKKESSDNVAAKRATKKLQEQAKLASAKTRAEAMFSGFPSSPSSSMNPNEVNDVEDEYSDFSDEESMTSGLKRSSALLMQMKKQSKTIDLLQKQLKGE